MLKINALKMIKRKLLLDIILKRIALEKWELIFNFQIQMVFPKKSGFLDTKDIDD